MSAVAGHKVTEAQAKAVRELAQHTRHLWHLRTGRTTTTRVARKTGS
jgi:hypothetical protein